MQLRQWRVLLLIVVLSGGFVGVVGADGHATADREIETTTADAGQPVEVTMNVTVTNETTVDYIEEFDPAYETVELVAVRNNGEDITPIFEDVTSESLLVATDDDVTSGTVEIVYIVTIPSSAETGSEYSFNGEVQVNEETVSITGSDIITVGSQDGEVDSGDDNSGDDSSTGDAGGSGSGESSGSDDSSRNENDGDDSVEDGDSSSSDDSDSTGDGESTDSSSGSDDTSTDDTNTGDSVPGFGVPSVLTALVVFMIAVRTHIPFSRK